MTLGSRSQPFACPRRTHFEIPTSTPRGDKLRWASSFAPQGIMPVLADNILPSAYRRPPTADLVEGLRSHSQRSLHRPFKVVLESPEREANHRLTVDVGTRGTPFEMVPAPPQPHKLSVTGQLGWLESRLELTPRPTRATPGPLAPRLAATSNVRGLSASAGSLCSTGSRSPPRSPHDWRGPGVAQMAFYVPPNRAVAALTPMREHASASGFSSEPFAGLR